MITKKHLTVQSILYLNTLNKLLKKNHLINQKN